LLLPALLAACVSDGPYIWVDELGANQLKPPAYKIQLGDRLVVNVWNQAPLSGEVLVRPDGNVTLPLVGDIYVLGMTPPLAADEIGKKLAGLVVDPHVAVSLAGTRDATVAVVGEVRAAGSYNLKPGDGVLDVLARAGGLSEFAARDRVFVIRKSESMRVRFAYDKLSRADGVGVQFLLQDGDVVVVE
jgi:polysaccharide export outer membrane protein